MDYYFLDRVPWPDSQALYHAAAYLQREAVIVLRPASPYVCLGCHQDARQEIDLEYTQSASLPVLRREVGGGAVYLDGNQLFFQFILRKDRPGIPADKLSFYRKFLQPVIATYREFGVPAEFKPVNDIVAGGRKVSGCGAAEIEGMVVLVGNFILDFDYEMMARVLRVPDEKFRDKVYKTLEENLSTFMRQTGKTPSTADLAAALLRHLEPLVGPFERENVIDRALRHQADAWFAQANTPEWLFENDSRRQQVEQIKVRAGVDVFQKVVKLPGGLVRILGVRQDGRLAEVHFSGDFFIYPGDALPKLEGALQGVSLELPALAQAIETCYASNRIDSPGVTPQALAEMLAA